MEMLSCFHGLVFLAGPHVSPESCLPQNLSRPWGIMRSQYDECDECDECGEYDVNHGFL